MHMPVVLLHMRKEKDMRISLVVAICTAMLIPGTYLMEAQPPQAAAPSGPGLTLTTTAFADGSEIPKKYTQADPNPVSPKLEWSNVPPNTTSFVLIMHDPDVAPQKKTEDILHWMAFNIPGTARELSEG